MKRGLIVACVIVVVVTVLWGPALAGPGQVGVDVSKPAAQGNGGAVSENEAGAARPTGSDFPRRYPKNEAEFNAMFDGLKNWGRWGKDDKLGTINLITEAKRKQAGALLKTGITVSLAHDLMKQEAPDNQNPLKHVMLPGFGTDTFFFQYHGQGMTHFDALCHQNQNNMHYNGVSHSLSNENGCVLGVDAFKDGILTRGILIDMPRLKGVPWLEPGTPVYPEDVEAWEKKVGVKISSGDAIFLRYGRWTRRAKVGPWKAAANAAGFHPSIAPWLKQRDVALVAAENTAEAQTEPPYMTEGVRMPLHVFLVAGLGMPIIDDVDLDALAETAARLNRYEFMVMIAPLRVPGGTGGPINPIAVF